jgi:hypothetical protein
MSYRCPRRGFVQRRLASRIIRQLHPAAEFGQAALVMVTGIAVLLMLTAGILVSTTTEHDPLVQNDVLQHLAYRGLEAGIDSYLTTINSNPNLINCNTSNTPGTPGYAGSTGSPGCTSKLLPALDTWTQVPNTSGDGSSIPEFYMWTNPQFCFSTVVGVGTSANPTCTAPATTAGATLSYVEEQVIGAAEIGNKYAYQSALAEFTPENGFLLNLFWSNYEATDPQTAANPNTAQTECTWDWNNSYFGPDKTNNSAPFPNSQYCNAVFFGPGDTIEGPVFSNDSIYVDQKPVFGVPGGTATSVTTSDPHCLFVDPNQGQYTPSGSTSCANASSNVKEYNTSTSKFNAPFEPLPTTDTELGVIASQDGCEYSGPTTIQLYYNTATALPYMTVSSPDTPTSGSSDLDNASTNSNNCGVGTNAGIGVPVPSGTKGNDVIFVENTPSSQQPCVSGANPFDDSADAGANAQPAGTAYYDVSGTSMDCEADVFVSNAPAATGTTPGVSGNLTIASQNNIVIDGNITYTVADCGSGFNSTYLHQCAYNSGTTPNDTLGLIAYHFVEVDHPITPPVTTTTCVQFFFGNCVRFQTTTTPSVVEPTCGTNGAPAVPLCDPAPLNSTTGLTIDAAILALNDEFAVNNYQLDNAAGNTDGTLTVYGAIAQDWRGAVGQFNSQSGALTSGYSKNYLWDSRLEYVTVPAYLNPGTPSWSLTSTGVIQSASNPCAATPNTTLPDPWPSTSASTPSCSSTAPPSASV